MCQVCARICEQIADHGTQHHSFPGKWTHTFTCHCSTEGSFGVLLLWIFFLKCPVLIANFYFFFKPNLALGYLEMWLQRIRCMRNLCTKRTDHLKQFHLRKEKFGYISLKIMYKSANDLHVFFLKIFVISGMR